MLAKEFVVAAAYSLPQRMASLLPFPDLYRTPVDLGLTSTETLLIIPWFVGTDIDTLDAASYSIFANPAILAISQDPAGSAIIRKWRHYVSSEGSHGKGEIQMHSGNLASGDYVVVLLNAAPEDMHMTATAADIFIDEGGSKSTEAKSAWDIYDLWANRMPDSVANQVLSKNSTVGVNSLDKYWYNATAMSYADGIAANHTLLMGTKVR